LIRFYSIYIVTAALTELISDAKSSFDPENIQGFIDAFLVEMNKGNDESFTVSENRFWWNFSAL